MPPVRKSSLGVLLSTLLVLAPMAPVAGQAVTPAIGEHAHPHAASRSASGATQASRHRTVSPRRRAETYFALGMVYEFGHGVPVDPYRAAQYYYQAAALYAARGALHHYNTCRDAMRRLNPDHPYLKPLQELVDTKNHPA